MHPPDEDPNWSVYPETLLVFHRVGRGITIDLRRPLTGVERRTLRALGPYIVLGVVTASNPVGRPASEVENRARHEQLRQAIVGASLTHLPTDGTSPDGAHQEEGFAVWTDRDTAYQLARQFEQSAFFWFDGDVFWVLSAMLDAPPRRLPHSPD